MHGLSRLRRTAPAMESEERSPLGQHALLHILYKEMRWYRVTHSGYLKESAHVGTQKSFP